MLTSKLALALIEKERAELTLAQVILLLDLNLWCILGCLNLERLLDYAGRRTDTLIRLKRHRVISLYIVFHNQRHLLADRANLAFLIRCIEAGGNVR